MATSNFTTLSPWLSTMNNHVQTEEKFKQEPDRPEQKLRRHYRLNRAERSLNRDALLALEQTQGCDAIGAKGARRRLSDLNKVSRANTSDRLP